MRIISSYSVLMSVYKAEDPQYLAESIHSIMTQTIPPQEFVLVCDGPLTADLENVIKMYTREFPNLIHIIRLKENHGLGIALNEGLHACQNEWIVRMDSDDIAFANRCEKQIKFAQENGLDVSSAWVKEFGKDRRVTGRRKVPDSHQEIETYAHKRNPMNHPCVVYRKSQLIRVGGYRDFPKFEDYDLWVRLLQNGAKMGNIQEPLLYMRAGKELYQRRAGLTYCRDILRFWQEMRRIGFSNGNECVFNIISRCAVSLLPNKVRQLIYKRKLRSQDGQSEEIEAISLTSEA